jgi:hypothetical protein
MYVAIDSRNSYYHTNTTYTIARDNSTKSVYTRQQQYKIIGHSAAKPTVIKVGQPFYCVREISTTII